MLTSKISKVGKVVICGAKGVGKTSILEQLIYGNVTLDTVSVRSCDSTGGNNWTFLIEWREQGAQVRAMTQRCAGWGQLVTVRWSYFALFSFRRSTAQLRTLTWPVWIRAREVGILWGSTTRRGCRAVSSYRGTISAIRMRSSWCMILAIQPVWTCLEGSRQTLTSSKTRKRSVLENFGIFKVSCDHCDTIYIGQNKKTQHSVNFSLRSSSLW